jgi:NTE family protein
MAERPGPAVPEERQEPAEPVRRIPTDDPGEPVAGTGLCLSGGGYRAMLFHLGVLWRLNEAGMLARLDRISSVSGGSITAATLGLHWNRLDFADGVARAFGTEVVDPIRALARRGIDVSSVLAGLVSPGTIAEKVAGAYRRDLFGDATLQDLPEAPRFVINATNMGSGALVRFERAQLADWRVGRIDRPEISLATAVACSSAFPPVLSPYRLTMVGADWTTEDGNDLAMPQHRDRLVLSDGGVYDNLGLETVWKRCKTVLVSDAGGQMAPDPDPDVDWPRHTLRVLKVIDNQVRALRKQQVIEGLKRKDRDGVYLGIRSHVADYGLADPLDARPDRTLELAELATRLDRLEDHTQERLINWGYVIADTGLRRHVDPSAERPDAPPYPATPI